LVAQGLNAFQSERQVEVEMLPFDSILDGGNHYALTKFREYMVETQIDHYLDFYLDAKLFERIRKSNVGAPALRDVAVKIFVTYFRKGAARRIQMEAGLYKRIERVILDSRYPVKPDLFSTAQQLIYHTMERFHVSFALTPQYQELLATEDRAFDPNATPTNGMGKGAVGAGEKVATPARRGSQHKPNISPTGANPTSPGAATTVLASPVTGSSSSAVSSQGSEDSEAPKVTQFTDRPFGGGDPNRTDRPFWGGNPNRNENESQPRTRTVSVLSVDSAAIDVDSIASLASAVGPGGAWAAKLVEAKEQNLNSRLKKKFITYTIRVMYTSKDGDRCVGVARLLKPGLARSMMERVWRHQRSDGIHGWKLVWLGV
jgi:hypothetical protein